MNAMLKSWRLWLRSRVITTLPSVHSTVGNMCLLMNCYTHSIDGVTFSRDDCGFGCFSDGAIILEMFEILS